MKRILLIFLALLCIAAISPTFFDGNSDYPDYIYNYLEHGEGRRMTVNLDDYIVAQKDLSEISAYNKESKKSVLLGDTVFDFKKEYAAVMFGIGNNLYYEARDPNTKTKAVYVFNLDTYEKEKVYSQSGMTDTDGFLGINELLGIYNTYTMDFSNAGKYIVNKDGFMYLYDVNTFLLENDGNDKYNIPTSSIKLSANKSGIYFLNNFDELLFYSYESDDIRRVIKDRVENFFITEDGIYFAELRNSDKLYKSDFDGKNKTYIGDIDLQDVRVKNGEPTYVSDGEKVCLLNGDKLKYVFDCEKDSFWEYDGKTLYIYDASSATVKTQKIK